jgi:hypothetical protein
MTGPVCYASGRAWHVVYTSPLCEEAVAREMAEFREEMRGEMADFSKKLTDQLNLDTAFVKRMGRPMTERDTQAVLWYFEQNLYNDMGIRVKPTSFGEGADAYAKRAKTQGGTGIQRRAGNGSAGSATPPNAAAP